MRKLLGFAALAAFVSLPAVALADCYVNARSEYLVRWYQYGSCYSYGNDARCTGHGSIIFHYKGDATIGCSVVISPNGSSHWDAKTYPWHEFTPDNKTIHCSQSWVNSNTLDVHVSR